MDEQVNGPVLRTGDASAYRITVDPARRIIHTEAHGLWTVVEARAYLADLDRLSRRARQLYGAALMLIDRRHNPVQSDEVAALFHHAADTLYHAEDRLAFLVSSSLVKAQLRRVITQPNTQCFVSPDAARTWLTAYQHAAVA